MPSDPVSKVEALAERALEASRIERERYEEAAKRNRERMPVVAKVYDEYREVFGEIQIALAEEGGVTLRKRISADDGGDGPRVWRNGKWEYK